MVKSTKAASVLLLFLGLFLLNPATGSAKLTTSCDCPGDDPMENSSSWQDPKKLRENIFSTSSCAPSSSSAKTAGAAMSSIRSVLEKDLKTPDEILNYMSCYRENDKVFCHFKNTLAKYISLSAESAGFPFAVQACLFFQESKFHPDAKSNIPRVTEVEVKKKDKTGKTITVKEKQTTYEHAYGYIQFMPETITDIKPIISGSIKGWQDEIKEFKAELEKEKAKLPSRNPQVKANINYYETRINVREAKIEAKKVWDSYWDGTVKKPTEISLDDVKRPKIAFALSATKQTYDLALMDHVQFVRNKGNLISINKMKPGESAVFLAGAYNAGIAGLASKCGSVKSLKECLAKYKTGSETWVHMSAIDRCSKKGSTESTIYDRDKKKFETKKDCKAYECK